MEGGKQPLLAPPPRRAQCGTSLVLLCVLTEMTALMYSGIVFGWAPMVLTLKREGLFADGCAGSSGGSESGGGDAPGSDCPSQTAKLTQIYSIGTVVYGASGVVQGALIDRFGPRFGIGWAGLSTIAGLYLFGCFVHDGELSPLMVHGVAPTDSTVVPLVGFVLLALGGMSFFLTSFKMVPLLPAERQGLAAAGLTTLGDASCSVFLIFNLLSSSFGLPLWSISAAYMAITLAMTLALLVLWSVNMSAFERQMSGDDSSSSSSSINADAGLDSHAELAAQSDGSGGEVADSLGTVSMVRAITAPTVQAAQTFKSTAMGVAWELHLQRKYGRKFLANIPSRRSLQQGDSSTSDSGSAAAGRPPLSERTSVVSQLLSLEFAFILLFSMVFFTRASLYLGLLGEFLSSPKFAAKYSAATQASYVNILSGMVPCGALFAPVIDPAIKRMGFLWYSLWVGICAAAYSLCMLVPSMQVQVLGCVFFTYFRANVFAFPGIYNLTVFGGRTVGTVQGLMFTLSAPLNYLSSPALAVTNEHFDGDFQPLNLLLIAVIAPVAILAIVMMCVTREAGMFPSRGEPE
jgi:hypothetical protein